MSQKKNRFVPILRQKNGDDDVDAKQSGDAKVKYRKNHNTKRGWWR